MKTVYRLYTEDKPNIGVLVGRYFDGATILHGLGLWKGTYEKSAVIEILTEDATKIRQLAEHIRMENRQEAVMVLRSEAEITWIQNSEASAA